MGTIKNDTVIYCTTEQETINVFNVLKDFNYKFDFTSGKEYWNKCANNSLCYRIDVNYIQFSNITFYKSCYPENIITAKQFLKEYMKEEQKSVKLTLTQAREMYPGACKDMKILLETTFPELIEPAYPKTHEELQRMLISKNRSVSYIDDCGTILSFGITTTSHTHINITLSEERSEEHIAFTQVIALMDYYNELDKFIPDWNVSSKEKYCITVCNNIIEKKDCFMYNRVLAFKTAKTRDLFYENFKELIEQCKNLL